MSIMKKLHDERKAAQRTVKVTLLKAEAKPMRVAVLMAKMKPVKPIRVAVRIGNARADAIMTSSGLHRAGKF
jgi:hypothetical protein